MNDKRKIVINVLIALTVIAAIAALVWFFWLKDFLVSMNAAPAYVNTVASVSGMDTGVSSRFSGIVDPQETYDVQSDATKTVATVHVGVGDRVDVGTLLFSYDTQEIQLQLQQAQLDLENISNQITTLQTQKKQLEEEKKKLSKDEQYAYTVQIQSVELQIKTQEYNSSLKTAEIEKIQNDLNNSEVYSEVSGTVKEINNGQQTDPTGQAPFMSILASGDYRIKGTVSELNLSSIYEGQAVTVYSRLDPSVTWQGTVTSVNTEPSEDDNSGIYYYDSGERSSKYDFYVSLQNFSGLVLGQHVYIEPYAETSAREGLWLPAAYIGHDEEGSFVWARDDSEKLEKRIITLGEYDSADDMYEIKSGLAATDYIAYPSDSLVEGAATIVDASMQFEPNIPMTGDELGESDPYADTLLPEAEILPEEEIPEEDYSESSSLEGTDEEVALPDDFSAGDFARTGALEAEG